MTEARIGRLLGASLHEAIAEELPQRLEFYEHWLRSDTLRDGTIGLAALSAVLSFLRTEGEGYGRVMARAGALAAEWTVASMSAAERRTIGWLPRRLRTRAALRVVARLVRSAWTSSRVSARLRRGTARLRVTRSLFCSVRAASSTPLCTFYLAACTDVLRRFDLPVTGRVDSCHAIDRGGCLITLELAGAAFVQDPAIAA